MRNKKLYGLVGVAALVAIGGTFAYYNSAQTFNNPFNTTNYSTQSTEKFNPNDGNEWKPGAEVDKEVYATNIGDGGVWVRVKFNEQWKRGDKVFGVFDSQHPEFNPADGVTAGTHQTKNDRVVEIVRDENGKPVVDERGDYVTEMVSKPDGNPANDTGSVVFKKFADDYADYWYFNEEDGYYYYKSSLSKDESTKKLLESVTLCGDADMGSFIDSAYYTVRENEEDPVPTYDPDDSSWKVFPEGGLDPDSEELVGKYVYTYKENKLDPNNQGYANANYELNINVEFVQVDEDAEAALAMGWKWTPLETNVPSIEEP